MELTLRVSIAALVNVIFENPLNGKAMLSLERTASLQSSGEMSEIVVKAKPFGGAVKLLNPVSLQMLIGEFHYDSERSQEEQDFRILINPRSWGKTKDICRQHLNVTGRGILEPGPERELEEEFADSLGIEIKDDDYYLQSKGMVIEDMPENTDNIYAPGFSTVRVYYLFEALIKNREIINMMLENSEKYSDSDLIKIVEENIRHGGKGRTNAVLTLLRDELIEYYKVISPDKRGRLLRFGKHLLDGHVTVILDEISNSKYQRFIS